MTGALQRFEQQVVALAGIGQAVHLALAFARDGQAEASALAASLGSVVALDAASPEAVFGGLAGVRTGLRLMVSQLRGQQRDPELVRITATVISLERRYARQPALQADLRTRLERIAADRSPDAGDETGLMASLADAYLATISTLTPRVRIPGNPLMLKDEDNIVRIRACLLAALRAAVLWRQLGGRGWRLVLQRSSLVETAQQLLGRSLAAV